MDNSSYNNIKTASKRVVQQITLTFTDQISDKPATFTKKYFPWIRIDQMKKDLSLKRFKKSIQWSQIRLFCKNIELQNNSKRFFDYNVDEENIIYIKTVKNQNFENGVINPYQIFEVTPPEIKILIAAVKSGLAAGRKPKLSEEGTSGTYFLENHEKRKIAIYKPFDEEPFTPNNPKGYIGTFGGSGIRKGILSGECATREVAPYLLDQSHFHGVPHTTYVQFYHPSFCYKQVISNNPIVSGTETNLNTLNSKHGSLQQFIQSNDVVGNLGCHQFQVQDVHKIGILDLRILNCDRNQANILVKKISVISKNQTSAKGAVKKTLLQLIPIDHGLSFPDNFQIYDYQMVWMSYPQSKKPFSQKSLEFIQNIDPDRDCKMLRQKLGFRQICLRNFKIAQIFLKKMAVAGFTLHQIGLKMYRTDEEDYSDQDGQNKESSSQKSNDTVHKSQLQKLVLMAQETYNVVKQNGIKSTVQFQIGLIKMRKQNQESSTTFFQQKKIQSQTFHGELEKIQENQIQQNFKHQEQNQVVTRQSSYQKAQQSKKVDSFQKQQPANSAEKLKNVRKVNFLDQKSQKVNQTSIEKMQKQMKQSEMKRRKSSSIPKVRNVSLPHLKKDNSISKRRRNKQIKKQKQKIKVSNNGKNNVWEEVFFHYFQDFVDNFIAKSKARKEKSKNGAKIIQTKALGRSRLMSEEIGLQDL